MKKILTVVTCTVLLAGCAMFKTSSAFQTNAGKFLATTEQTVDQTMKVFAALDVAGKISANDEQMVRGFYANYQVAFMQATNVYNIAVTTSDASLFTSASNNLVNAKQVLVNKITQ